jgi:hypothetical protein
MTRPLPTCERLREAFDYDSDTGKLTWRIKRANCAPGDAAGCPRDDGVLLVMLDYKLMKAHRLIWCWVFGEWPIEAIDHKDGDNQNNRIENLRDVSTETNAQNRRKSSGRTGVLGVSPSRGKFAAYISVNNRTIGLGRFDRVEQAAEAYTAAKRRLHAGCTI